MSRPQPSDEQLKAVADAWRAYRNEDKAAASLEMSRGAFRTNMCLIAKRAIDESIIADLPVGHVTRGVSTLVGADGEVKLQWLKSSPDLTPADVIELSRDAFDNLKPAKPSKPPKHTHSDLLTVYPYADWHLGLYAWAEEAGTDWDLSIAQEKIGAGVRHLVDSAPNAETAVALFLGDLLHADNSENKTWRNSNPLDVDTRYGKVIEVTIALVCQCIDMMLAKHRNVVVRLLPGNHDDHSAITLAHAVAAYYRNDERVDVMTSPSRFFFYSFGSVFIGATHGDMCKMADLPGYMAGKEPEAWGTSSHRYGYTGHIHTRKETANTIMGVRCEAFETPVAPDAWSTGMGFLPGRSMVAITHHAEQGEVSRNRVAVV